MIEKRYLSANDLLADSFRLANKILDSDFRPTHIVGIWRGGAAMRAAAAANRGRGSSRSALIAQSAVVAVIADNIANARTPDYAQRSASLVSMIRSGRIWRNV